MGAGQRAEVVGLRLGLLGSAHEHGLCSDGWECSACRSEGQPAKPAQKAECQLALHSQVLLSKLPGHDKPACSALQLCRLTLLAC